MPGNAPHETPADAVLDRIASGDPPYKIGYQRGDETVEEKFATVTRRGESTIELEFSDGRHVTERELEEVM